MTERIISLSEVEAHQSENDFWLVHGGNVYNITDFIQKHPGGAEVIAEYSHGQDIVNVMASKDPHKHTQAAYNVLFKRHRYVGKLATENGHDVETHNGNGVVNRGHTVSSSFKVPYKSDEEEKIRELSAGYEDQTAYLEDWENDDLVDWSKPLFWQVGKLGSSYMDWVHVPVERNVRLFYSDFCEFCSKCPWYTIPIIWVPIMFYMLWLGYSSIIDNDILWLNAFGSKSVMQPRDMIPLFIVGSIFWSFLEYGIHRYLFHSSPPANWPLLIQAHFLMHGQHHKDPLNKLRLVFPPVPASSLAIPVIVWFIFWLPKGVSHVLLAGIAMGYMLYDLTHYYIHHGSPKTSYMKKLKNLHIRHHFEDVTKGYGISLLTHFLDYPFQTNFKDDDE